MSSTFDPTSITRPSSRLMKYYVLTALVSGPFFPIVIIPLFFKYETLRYKFDESGVSMSWGILFRKEIQLTYRRIQDIHLSRNLIQRWMGLATLGIQTASGSSGPEMSIEGVLETEQLRDYLYSEMRGAREHRATEPGKDESTEPDEALVLLTEIRDALQSVCSRGKTS